MKHTGVAEPFRNGNFSLFFSGQVLSQVGMWFQNLTLSLVVMDLTGSAQALSMVTVAQFTPVLLLSMWAGRVADRLSARRILLVTSLASALIIGALAWVFSFEHVSLPSVFALIFAFGCAGAFERVAAQSIVYELLGPTLLGRGAALSTMTNSVSRSIGPAIAGLAFVGLGPVWCMLVTSISFLFVSAAMILMRVDRMHLRPISRERAQGAWHLMRRPPVRALIIVSLFFALFASSFGVTLTSVASFDFGGDGVAVGLVHSLNAVGAVIGGLIAASRPPTKVSALVGGAVLVGVAYLINAASPNLGWFIAVGPVLGLAAAYFRSTVYAVAQVIVAPEEIGRMMSLVSLVQFGAMPVGAILAGALVDATSGRMTLAIGAGASLLCAAVLWMRGWRPSRGV